MVPLFAETSPVHALIEPTRVSGTGCPACVGHDCLRFGNAGLYARNACPVCVMACRIGTTNLRHDRHRGSNFCPVHALLRVVSCMEWLIDGLLFPRRERCHRRCNAVTPGAGIAVRQRFVPVQARTSGAPNDRRVRIIGINFCPGHDATFDATWPSLVSGRGYFVSGSVAIRITRGRVPTNCRTCQPFPAEPDDPRWVSGRDIEEHGFRLMLGFYPGYSRAASTRIGP